MPNPGRLIVAEDNAVAALSLEVDLTAAGHEVCGMTSTGRGAVRLAELRKPDLAILDVELADTMSGMDAALEIERRFGIPTVFVSGHLSEDEARAAGGWGLLRKPYSPKHLTTLVAAVLHWRRKGVVMDPPPHGLIRREPPAGRPDAGDVVA